MIRNACCLLALAAVLPLTGCGSSPMSSIGSISNTLTGKNSISDTDRVFLMAAGSWDRNHDNLVTCDEWKAYATELFNGADADRDDSLEPGEWSHIVGIDRMFDTANFSYYDTNGDGKVTRAEFVDRENPAFKLMDTGKTCKLTGEQLAGARSKTQYDTAGKPRESGDPREKKGGENPLGH